MANTDFSVLLKAELDRDGLNTDLKQVQEIVKKYHLELTPDLQTKSLRNQFRSVCQEMANDFNRAFNANVSANDVFKVYENKAKQLQQTLEKVNKIQHSLSIGDYDTQLKAYSTALQKAGIEGTQLTNKLQEANTALSKLKESANGNDIIPDNVITKANILEDEFEKLANTIKNVKLDNSLVADDLRVESTITSLKEQLRKNSAYAESAKNNIRAWIAELKKGNVAEARLKQINVQAKELHSNMASLGKIGFNAFDKINNAIEKFTGWSIITGTVMAGWHMLKQIPSDVKKLADSLLELDKVTDLSAEGLANVAEQAYDLGDKVARTGSEVIDATTEFKRAGYALKESMDMAESAMVMTNVAENITDTADAAGTLISVLKGFNMDASQTMEIVDKINQVSNTSPISFDNIAEGLERTAGTMAQSGNTIDETIGLLTAGYAQLRNVEKVSQGLITISARLRGVGEDGEAIDGLSSKMKKSFGEIGIAIENADGSLRSIYEIAQDYAKVLPTLTDKQKQYYSELAAGKHQLTVWNAITQQFQDAENAVTQSLNSENSALDENQKKLESLSGKINIFNSAMENLSNTILNSGILGFFVDLGTIGVKGVTNLVEALTPLGSLLTIGSGVLGANGLGLTIMLQS